MNDPSLLDLFASFLPLILMTVLLVIGLVAANTLLTRKLAGTEGRNFLHIAIMIALAVLGGIIIVLILPVDHETRGQLLGLFGLAVTAILTLASTSFFANAMAGLMNRIIASFQPGDFIEVEGILGRVTERGLFHVEIQTEDRDLTTIPNLYLTTHPLKVVHSTGTVISAYVSLGYDVSHVELERLFLQAVEKADLTDPFVHITELGDYSVTYRVAGFLEEVKHLLSARSRLRVAILDELHQAKIEIASPSIMMQRPISTKEKLIPANQGPAQPSASGTSGKEDLIFDKAEEAATLASLRETVKELTANIQELEAAKPADRSQIDAMQASLDQAVSSIKEIEELAAQSNSRPKK